MRKLFCSSISIIIPFFIIFTIESNLYNHEKLLLQFQMPTDKVGY